MPEVIAIQTQPTPQQVIDGLPVFTKYRDTPGSPNMPGPRTPGICIAGGKEYSANGYIQGGPQDPTLSPIQQGIQGEAPLGTRPLRRFNPPPLKPMYEPAQYVKGQGWVTSANS